MNEVPRLRLQSIQLLVVLVQDFVEGRGFTAVARDRLRLPVLVHILCAHSFKSKLLCVVVGLVCLLKFFLNIGAERAHVGVHSSKFGNDIFFLFLKGDIEGAVGTNVNSILSLVTIILAIFFVDHHLRGQLAGRLFTLKEHALHIIIVVRDFVQSRVCILIHVLDLTFDVTVGL